MSETLERGPIQEFCANVWWLVLIRGIALLVLGGLLLAKPALAAITIVQFLGAYFLVDGVFSIINSIMGRKYMQGWGWGLIMGGLEILTGIIIFGNPLMSTILTASLLVYCVAAMAILLGLIGIMTGFMVRKEVKGEWAMIAGGVLAIIFGVILILNPLGTIKIYLVLMGVAALLGGVTQIFAAFQIRQIGKKGIASIS